MQTLLMILIGIAKFLMSGAEANPKQVILQADFQAITNALDVYKMNATTYPSTEQGLKVLIEKPKIAPLPKRWRQIMNEEPLDPWGRKYQYKLVNKKVQLWSKGPNPKEAIDDIYFPPKKVVEQVEAPDGK